MYNALDDDDDDFDDGSNSSTTTTTTTTTTSTTTTVTKPDKSLKRFSALGVRMKEYESVYTTRIDTKQPYIIRLDGHKFSTFTRPFKKPFDLRIHNAMRKTLSDLVEQFRPATGFTCSDEITLIFPLLPVDEKTGEGPQFKSAAEFDAKVSKLTTLTAGFASVCFYKYLSAETFDQSEQNLVEHIERTKPHFDSRIFNVPSNTEVMNNLLWRASWDFKRNSISTLAQAHFSPKQLHGKNTKEQLAMLIEKGISWDAQPDWYKWGVFAKREKFLKETEVKGSTVLALRTKVTVRSFPLVVPSSNQNQKLTPEQLQQKQSQLQSQEHWITAKHWPLTEDVVKFEQNNNSSTEKDTS